MAGGHSGSWPGFFRVFAVFAALMLLLAQGAQELVPPTSGAWQVLSVYEGLTRWSIPALFLLWGMSTLEGGGRGGLSGALLGRVLPAFCMLVFWGAAYAVAAHLLGGGALSWSGIGSALLSAARGDTYFHLWPLYPLVGLYLIQPLLARFTASASRNEVLYLLGLSFLMASLLPLWAAFHPNHALVVLLDRFQIHAVLGWVGYYLAGWYLHHYMIGRIPEFLIYLLGILGVVLTLAGPRLIGGGRELWYSYTAPGVACTAVALCVLFRYVLGVSEEPPQRGVRPGGVCIRHLSDPPALGPGVPVVRSVASGLRGGPLCAGICRDLFSAVPPLCLADRPYSGGGPVADGVNASCHIPAPCPIQWEKTKEWGPWDMMKAA